MLLYSLPLSKAALESTGPLYNTNPETAVSSGPFILRAFERDQQVVYERNPAYAGTLDVPIQRIVIRLAAPSTWFTLYQSGEIDFMANPAPQELQLAQADPALSQQIYSSVGDFRTFYLFFDVNTAPFDNPLVRQAFSHAVDRDAIQQALLGPAGVPAYSWLAPGFPAANGEALRGIQAYDPDRAKQLLADAGFPNGEGFPKQTMQLRAENPLNQTVAQAVAQGLSETLGIEVEVANQDYNLFTADLNAEPTKIPFGYVSYGMDFLDPYNMLSVWLTSGRHSYSNPEFDRLVDTAASFTGPAEERIAMFQEAERILVGDVPGVFVYHETPVQLVKPYMAGPALTPDENGLTNIHWPGYCAMSTVPAELYVGADAPADRG
jgi:peptide/nickel transport system substrate-binding protein/oligopeptide transport system substrate-binding protein